MRPSFKIKIAKNMRIVIIEDIVQDLLFYRPLTEKERDISLVFLTHDAEFTKDKLKELVEFTSEDMRHAIKNYYVVNKENILSFFDANHFDFFIVDSLGGLGEQLAHDIPFLPGMGVFVSSTSEFRNIMIEQGYRAYPKDEVEKLISDCGL